MSELINLTKSAKEHIYKMIKQKNAVGFRLSVRKSGCSGYRYHPEVVFESKDTDLLLETSEGLKIYVEPESQKYIAALTIDYVQKGLGHTELVYSNPNAHNECGCGESFNLKKDDHDTD